MFNFDVIEGQQIFFTILEMEVVLKNGPNFFYRTSLTVGIRTREELGLNIKLTKSKPRSIAVPFLTSTQQQQYLVAIISICYINKIGELSSTSNMGRIFTRNSKSSPYNSEIIEWKKEKNVETMFTHFLFKYTLKVEEIPNTGISFSEWLITATVSKLCFSRNATTRVLKNNHVQADRRNYTSFTHQYE